MALPKKVLYMFLGGLLALALVFGAALTFAQTGDDDQPEPTLPEEEVTTETEEVPFSGSRGHWRMDGLIDSDEELAEALGISLEELQAARQQVREELIAQAVADGLMTQEQADALLANGSGRLFGRGGHFGFGSNHNGLLAEALGISIEELQAARAEVRAARLAAMVEAGYLTQEQADAILARQAVMTYLDRDALQAAVQSAYEAAVAAALDAGAISQEQADALLEDIENLGGFGMGGFGMQGGMMGGPGGRDHGRGMPGGMGMPGFFQNSQPSVTEPAAGA
jgi:hypothetical protein